MMDPAFNLYFSKLVLRELSVSLCLLFFGSLSNTYLELCEFSHGVALYFLST